MTLRIIGGEFKGRLLKAPKGFKTRPTLSILRKAVFDMLQFTIQNTRFLDLFAGSGLMGIEALSRGAAHTTFVDNNSASIRCIEENLKLLGLHTKGDVLALDATAALQRCAKKKLTFDIIYIDPPYKLSQTTPILQKFLHFIDTQSLLSQNGTVLVEERAPPTLDPDIPFSHLRYIKSRQFSDSIVHQYLRPLAQ